MVRPRIATPGGALDGFAKTPEPAQAVRDEIGAVAAEREAMALVNQRIGQLTGRHLSLRAQDP